MKCQGYMLRFTEGIKIKNTYPTFSFVNDLKLYLGNILVTNKQLKLAVHSIPQKTQLLILLEISVNLR